MKQEVTRAHAKERWSLDDVVLHAEVTEFGGKANVKKQPSEGVYIHGLYLDGCAWSKADNSLVESSQNSYLLHYPFFL